MTTNWTQTHLQDLKMGAGRVLPFYGAADWAPPSNDSYFWDFWPVLTESGDLAVVDGFELWMSLSAPRDCDPGERHHRARLHLHTCSAGVWQDRGVLLPAHYSLGSHEWSGSAIYYPESQDLHLFYTAVGDAESPGPSYVQRLAQAVGTIVSEPTGIAVAHWRSQIACVDADGHFYAVADQVEGEAGFIKAFRDPYYFLDPVSGTAYLLFTSSVANPETRFAGSIGIAVASAETDSPWRLCPPLLEADGVNNEMERAHVIFRDGLYYVFWSTQSRTFDPSCAAPTGLYGAVGKSIMGPYQPLNGSGLVLTNPEQSPSQCYAWQVLPDLRVISFIDSVPSRSVDPAAGQDEGNTFVGTMSPAVYLNLDGDRTQLVASRSGLQSQLA